MDSKHIRLTETVQKGGCAAKLPAGSLRNALNRLKLSRLPELIVGTETMDDAALWDLGDGRFLIQTLDFFTPIVDSSYDFGAIAACNAISDIYAMGGDPKTALTILAFPTQTLSSDILDELMAGAVDKIQEAGACLAGGHTIEDETLKLGFSVTGFVEKARAWTNQGAQPGDALILTKPLGTGTITSALKQKRTTDSWIKHAVSSMTTLNRAPELLKDFHIHAATDITGFGLAGHALQMAEASQQFFEIDVNSIPILEGALECLENGILNRAHRTNLDYVQNRAQFESVNSLFQWLTVDPQTSGGLLLSVPQEQAPQICDRLRNTFSYVAQIGRCRETPSEARLRFVSTTSVL